MSSEEPPPEHIGCSHTTTGQLSDLLPPSISWALPVISPMSLDRPTGGDAFAPEEQWPPSPASREDDVAKFVYEDRSVSGVFAWEMRNDRWVFCGEDYHTVIPAKEVSTVKVDSIRFLFHLSDARSLFLQIRGKEHAFRDVLTKRLGHNRVNDVDEREMNDAQAEQLEIREKHLGNITETTKEKELRPFREQAAEMKRRVEQLAQEREREEAKTKPKPKKMVSILKRFADEQIQNPRRNGRFDNSAFATLGRLVDGSSESSSELQDTIRLLPSKKSTKLRQSHPQQGRDTRKSQRPKPTSSILPLRPSPSKVANKIVGTKSPETQSPIRGQLEKERRQSSSPSLGQGERRSARPATSRRSSDSTSDGPKNSPSAISRGEYVFRLREKGKNDDFESRADESDIYDGPFAVIEVSASKGSLVDDGQVMLALPHDSLAKLWTPLRRVRKTFVVPPGADPHRASKGALYMAAMNAYANVHLRLRVKPSTLLVAKIDDLNFATGQLISPDGLGGDSYEVDKLRRKRIVLRDRKTYRNEKATDQEVQMWIQNHGKLMKKDQVAVVEYLVHWAGWPSEDDTWERGQGNIPKTIIDAFEANHCQETLFPERQRK